MLLNIPRRSWAYFSLLSEFYWQPHISADLANGWCRFFKKFKAKTRANENIAAIHDVYIWSIGYGIPAFSGHILVNDVKISETDEIKKEIEEKLSALGIKHTILQAECVECQANGLYCQITPGE